MNRDLKFEDMMAAMMASAMPQARIGAIAGDRRELAGSFDGFDPFKLVASFGALLTVPELQCNCIRLEALVHLGLLLGGGKRKPTPKLMQRAFAALDTGPVGAMEDPAEDMFVTSIATSRGNFRILEGIWESSGFFLQRFVNVVERLPASPGWDEVREAVFALLKLSDAVCERAGLARWQKAQDGAPRSSLPGAIASQIRELRRRVCFNAADITAMGIATDHLSAFVLAPSDRGKLTDEELGNTTLERYPVLWRGDDFCLALPTAVGAAVRRLILERVAAANLTEAFVGALGEEYAQTFSRLPLLGGDLGAPIRFAPTKTGHMACLMSCIDTGRYLNFIFVMDTLKDVEITGIAGLNPDFSTQQDDVEIFNAQAIAAAQKEKDFREGATLVVSCGIGRGIAGPLRSPKVPNWRQEFISAADLYTLSWTEGFDALSLWRLLDGEEQLAALDVHLQNINGLVNLVAWQRSHRGHLIPHNQLSEEFGGSGGPLMLMIPQNGLKDVRHGAAHRWDPHVIQDVHGQWVSVRKQEGGLFAEDAAKPLYSAQEFEGAVLPIVYAATRRAWWGEVIISEGSARAMGYERWKMLGTWLSRLAPVLDKSLAQLPVGPILWRVVFQADLQEHLESYPTIGLDEAKNAISVTTDKASHIVTLDVAAAFEGAHFNPENIAERALVERTIDGFAELAGLKLDDTARNSLVARIIPDGMARQTHAFRAKDFRDIVRESRAHSVVLVHEDDDAALRIGLGWLDRKREEMREITGKKECTSFLNAVVKRLEAELCAELSKYDRTETLHALLLNHERAAVDRDRWHRTASAVVALHNDKAAAFEVIAMREGRLNAVFQATRTLIEIAYCECPAYGGLVPGDLDLSRLMARMNLIIHIGGWSGAIWQDAIEPRLRINPLGDIQLNHDFQDSVIEPFGRAAADVRIRDAIESYSRNLDDRAPRQEVASLFEPDFLLALEDELGANLDDIRLFLDHVENLGVKSGSLIVTAPRSAYLIPEVEGNTLSLEVAEKILSVLALPRRAHWRDLPEGYEEKDIDPWRYRRRLSLLRKPLLQIDDGEDPAIMVAPGLLRDGFVYSIGNYYRGTFPQGQLKPLMRSWRGKTSDAQGTAFNGEVAVRLKELGWKARPDINMSAILGKAHKALGDIDVLAWNRAGRVLLIECKDLLFGKTMGEIAEQLADFRGVKRADGRPDDLLKHLRRIDAIYAGSADLAKFIGEGEPLKIEGHLVFRNPVPMQFAWDTLKARVGINLFDELDRL
jgi:hypothetical protein